MLVYSKFVKTLYTTRAIEYKDNVPRDWRLSEVASGTALFVTKTDAGFTGSIVILNPIAFDTKCMFFVSIKVAWRRRVILLCPA